MKLLSTFVCYGNGMNNCLVCKLGGIYMKLVDEGINIGMDIIKFLRFFCVAMGLQI